MHMTLHNDGSAYVSTRETLRVYDAARFLDMLCNAICASDQVGGKMQVDVAE